MQDIFFVKTKKIPQVFHIKSENGYVLSTFWTGLANFEKRSCVLIFICYTPILLTR